MASRKNEFCFKHFDEALAENPETYGHIDVLCGGWPCQDNSIAGTRKGHKGERSGLWSEYRRIAELFKPRWIIAENVPGLLSVNGGRDFIQVIKDLDEIGYCVAWTILDSQNFGVPQQRKRVVIVGSLGNVGAAKVLFEPESDNGDSQTIKEGRKELLCATTVRTSESGKRTQGYIAYTITTGQRGVERRPRQGNYIAEINAKREGEVAGLPDGLDAPRGLVIGNAVTVNVAKWIGERIIKIEAELNPILI